MKIVLIIILIEILNVFAVTRKRKHDIRNSLEVIEPLEIKDPDSKLFIFNE